MFSFHFALLAVIALLFCMAAAAPVPRDGTAADVTRHQRRVPLHSWTASTDSSFEAPATDGTIFYVRSFNHKDTARNLRTTSKRRLVAKGLWQDVAKRFKDEPAIMAEAERELSENILAIAIHNGAAFMHETFPKKIKPSPEGGFNDAREGLEKAEKSIERANALLKLRPSPPPSPH